MIELRKGFRLGTNSLIFTILVMFLVCSACSSPSGNNPETYNLGDIGPGGGVVFYHNPGGIPNMPGCFYLEAAPVDQDTGAAWASSIYMPPPFGTGSDYLSIDGTGTGIGTGRMNTALILATDTNAPAARACRNYTGGGWRKRLVPAE